MIGEEEMGGHLVVGAAEVEEAGVGEEEGGNFAVIFYSKYKRGVKGRAGLCRVQYIGYPSKILITVCLILRDRSGARTAFWSLAFG
jgi:hypothetical protein